VNNMPYLNCNGQNIYYEINGIGPPLLLINGLGGDTRSWELFRPHIEKHFQTVIFDMRCAGKSDKPKEQFSISDLSEDTVQLIKGLGHKKINILGFSMGGEVALDLAVRHSDVIDDLFLVSTLASWKRPHPPSEKTWEIFSNTEVNRELLAEVFNIIFGPAYKEIHSADEYIDFRLSDPDPQPVFSYLNQLNACKNFDLYDKVSEINSNTLVITGDSDHVM